MLGTKVYVKLNVKAYVKNFIKVNTKINFKAKKLFIRFNKTNKYSLVNNVLNKNFVKSIKIS